MTANILRHFVAVLLPLQLLLAPHTCVSANYCLPTPVFTIPDSSIIDITGNNLKASTEYRLSHATSSDFILIDSASINKESSVKALRRSKATIVFKTENGKDAAKQLLDQQIQAVEILAAIPDDAHGVNLMYHSDTGKFSGVVDHYAKAATNLKQISDTKVISKSPNTSKISSILLNEAKSKDKSNKLLVIIGHNENGILCLPDGSRVKVADLSNASLTSKRPILILSCETLHSNLIHHGFVTTRALYFDEIVKSIKNARANDPKTVADFVRNINEGFVPATTSNKKYKVAAVSFAGGSVIVATVYTNTGLDCKEYPLSLGCLKSKK